MNKPGPRHTQRDRHGKPFAPRSPAERRPDTVWIYGLHAAEAALANPRRQIARILATPNALQRLADAGVALPLEPEETTPRDLDRLLGGEAVHQGIALEAKPLAPATLDDVQDARLIVVLDQITDPHNVGAILRTAVAFAAEAVVTTGRHAAIESGALAKAASGALDRIAWVEVPNLARALEEMGEMGFTRVGLDSDAETEIEEAPAGTRVALVLGAEGKGLRRLTREHCDALVRLSMPGAIRSLNVSNAAALALYVMNRRLRAR